MEQNYGKAWIRQVALACFFVSGACGLIYQVTWTRMLGLVFGNTVFATSTVLTAFMSGLALGSFLAGKYADRIGRSLRVYAILEIGIGFYCIFIPLLIKLIEGIYLPLQRSMQMSFYYFSLVRFILCFLLLVIPTILMGATTPFFSKAYVERSQHFGHGIGRLYAINTFGAFTGVMLSGFLMLERLGILNTIIIAVAGNITVAIICLFLDYKLPKPQAESLKPKQKAKKAIKTPETAKILPKSPQGILVLLIISYGVSGFAALAYEVAWTRILAMIIGSSVYAFSIMLATFLMGLTLGSFIFSIIARKVNVNLLWFAIAELIVGLAAVITLPLFEQLPLYLVSLFTKLGFNYIALELSRFLLCAMVILVPTILLGSLFPMVTQICTRDYSELGRKVGTVYSVNTLGNILGSFVSGFILLPYIGIQKTIILAAIFNITVGCVTFLAYPSLKFRYRAITTFASAVLVIFCVLVIPSWNKMLISSGASVYAPRYSEVQTRERKESMSGWGEKLLYYKDGLGATVTVRKRPDSGTVVMAVNGKVDASNSGDMYTQLMVGHIPLVLSPDPKTALVIGLGSGATAGAVAQHPLEHIDCVEIEKAVVEASDFFKTENRNVLKDPRVNLIVNDGRNYLVTTAKKYDVIVSEPSNLWLAGMSNLFSLEFYQLCKEHLNPKGTIIQWVHIYHMSPENLATVIGTFRTVFPYTTLWYTMLGDLFMLGTHEELEIDYMELAKRYNNISGFKEDMQRLDIREPLALLSCYLLDKDAAAKFATGHPINTDNKPILEFSTPRTLYMDTANLNHKRLTMLRTSEFPKMKNFDQERVEARASFWYHLAVAYDFKDMPYEAQKHYEKAISVDTSFAPAYVGLGLDLYKDAKLAEAIDALKKAIALDPIDSDAYYNIAQVYQTQGSRAEAISNYRKAIELSPQPWRYHQKLTDLLIESGDHTAALQLYQDALNKGKNKARALYEMSKVYKAMGKMDVAVSKIQEAIQIEPSQPQLYEELGSLYETQKDYEKAITAYKRLLELQPDSVFAQDRLDYIDRIQKRK